MRKPRSYAEVYNDLDDSVVNLFRVLRDPQTAERLRSVLRDTPFARAEHVLSREATTDPIEFARRTVVQSLMGFAGGGRRWETGFRSNSNRSGTTPATDFVTYLEALRSVTERLRGVVIEQRDALDVLAQHDSPLTLHYVDPPYVMSSRGERKQQYRREFSDDDHRRLSAVLSEMTGAVILSGYHNPLYDELYRDWPHRERAALADGARKRTEVLWFNERAWEFVNEARLFA